MKNYKYILWAGRIISAIEIAAIASAICLIICLFITNNGGLWNSDNHAFRCFANVLAILAIFGIVGRLFLRSKIVEACHRVFGDEEISNTVYFDDDVSEEDIAEYMKETNARYAEAKKMTK